MDPLDVHYWVSFTRFMKFGAVRMKKLYTHFPSLQAAWEASPEQLMLAGIDERLSREFAEWRRTVTPYQELERCIVADIHPVTVRDSSYPALLREIYDAPAVLFVRGSVQALRHTPLLAVVGARMVSDYGRRVTDTLVEPLARAGVGIVSGLALGTDGNAHRAALRGGGVTIAVLGGGVDDGVLYPPAHRSLAAEIVAAGGAVVSEFPPQTAPLKHFFPMRNRIISGMSTGTLVIEAAASSGALITAQSALDQNRDVFAVPGPIMSPHAVGTNGLLRTGAVLAGCADDILAHIQLPAAPAAPAKLRPDITEDEARLLAAIGDEPTPLDYIIERTGIAAAAMAPLLLALELKGVISQSPGGGYIRSAG